MKTMKRLFSMPKKKNKNQVPSQAISSLGQLHEAAELLEKKERLLQKKISSQDENIKEYMKIGNKKAAIQCLKKKKLYEKQLEQLGNLQLKTHDQMITLEGAKATTDTIDALKAGSAAVKSIHNSLNVDDIGEAIEEANELTENMKQIQEALATPVGLAAELDEDELEAELEELDELDLDEQLQQMPSVTSTTSTSSLPSRTNLQEASDIDKLTARQAEMSI